MTDDPTRDETPVWFTPPDRGSTSGWPSPPSADPEHPQASASAPAPAAEPEWLVEEFRVTPPEPDVPVRPPRDSMPVTPAETSTPPVRINGLAPPTPIIRPLTTSAEPTATSSPFLSAPPASALPIADLLSSAAATPAPPTPIIRAVPPGSSGVPTADPIDDDGGRGWRVREQRSATVPPVAASASVAAVEEERRPSKRRRRIAAEPPAPAADQAASAAPPPEMPWDGTAVHRPMRRYLLFGVGLFALCGLTAAVISGVGRAGPGIQQPGTIGAQTLVHTPQVDAIAQSFDRYERSAGAVNVVTGAYGDSTTPQLLLVVAQGGAPTAGGTTQATASAFIHGLSVGSGIGWTLDPAKLTTTTVDGTTYVCDSGPSSQLDGIAVVACAWSEKGLAGAAIDLSGQPLADTLNATVEARAAAVH